MVALGLALLALGASSAEAGIIVLKNGKVFIGRIDPEDVTEENVTMRSPRLYKGAPPVRGEQKFPKYEVRWFDPNADEPTDEYMKLYENEEIDQRYAVYVQRWKERKENQLEVGLPIIPTIKTGSLSAISITKKWTVDEISIRKPTGWKSTEVNDILMFESDEKKTDGYAPRIHVFSVERANVQPSDQISWVRDELQKLAQGEGFETRGDVPSPKVNAKGGFDVRWSTATRHKGKTIRASRKIFFRDRRTYFITCYAHEKDFDQLAILFDACMGSLQINEGGAASKGDGAENIDTSAVAVGQTYRWKSASVPDAFVWEVTAKEAAAVRFRTTVTRADGSKKTTETSEAAGPLDPVARLGAIAAAPVSPQKVSNQKETIAVGAASFECDVYEANANGKKYRLWVSRKFPIEVKLTIDGVVEKELAEIK